MSDIDAAAQGDDRWRHHFGQQAAEFGAAQQHVIRPFDQRNFARQEFYDEIVDRERRHETHLRGDAGVCFDCKEKGSVEVSGLGNPAPAQTSASAGLFMGHDPQWTALACFGQAARFGVGGIDPLEMEDAMPRCQLQ